MVTFVKDEDIQEMKLVSGWHKGICGDFSFGSDAATVYNEEDPLGLKLVAHPVTFEGTLEPAFWVMYSHDTEEMTEEEAQEIAKSRADALVAKFNK